MKTSLPEVDLAIDLPCGPPASRLRFENTSWEEIAVAFADAPSCQLRQSWRKRLHPRFAPAAARVAWTPDALWVYAEMQDEDIFNTATSLNQNTFLLGDAFEIFLHPLPGEEYFELHVTPDDVHLQLHFTPERPVRRATLSTAMIADENFFRSRSSVESQAQCWRVLAEIPARNLIGRNLQSGDQWLFSFSRYDYTRGHERPILSSTSSHSRPHFHDREDWGTLNFTK